MNTEKNVIGELLFPPSGISLEIHPQEFSRHGTKLIFNLQILFSRHLKRKINKINPKKIPRITPFPTSDPSPTTVVNRRVDLIKKMLRFVGLIRP